jgi:hypothetical protein
MVVPQPVPRFAGQAAMPGMPQFLKRRTGKYFIV